MSNALNNVYNHYLAAYAPPSVTKYDAHKKSELRGIYNSIVRINKESPWYLPLRSAEISQYAIGLKENARELHNTIASLSGISDSDLLSKKTAASSNAEIATASYIGDDTLSGETPSVTLDIRSLAMSQENMGKFLANTPVLLSPDTYSFDVQINDMNYEFQFSVGENETNRELQNRLCKLINNSGVGLKAEVQETDDKSALVITSEATGLTSNKNQIFSITDDHTSKSRGAVSYLGINYMSRNASNAELFINGEPFSSQSNRFMVGKMFEVDISSTTPQGKPVTIGLKTDIESLTDNITGLTEGYNRFIQNTLQQTQSQPKSKNLLREVSGISLHYTQAFSELGLSTAEDGTLKLDKDKLKDAIMTSPDLETTFQPLKDFSKRLMQKSNQVSINPMTYVDKKIVAYKNPAGPNYANPYITSAYSGMMFNSYC